MRDFSAPYSKVVYFGLFAEGPADKKGATVAVKILENAVRMTFDEDARSQDVVDAIEYLGKGRGRDRPYRDFLAALELRNPGERYHAAQNALLRIKRDHSLGDTC